MVTPITLLAIKRAEARLGRKLSFAEVTHPEAGHLEPMLAGEMQWAMQTMFVQYQDAAETLQSGRRQHLAEQRRTKRSITRMPD